MSNTGGIALLRVNKKAVEKEKKRQKLLDNLKRELDNLKLELRLSDYHSGSKTHLQKIELKVWVVRRDNPVGRVIQKETIELNNQVFDENVVIPIRWALLLNDLFFQKMSELIIDIPVEVFMPEFIDRVNFENLLSEKFCWPLFIGYPGKYQQIMGHLKDFSITDLFSTEQVHRITDV